MRPSGWLWFGLVWGGCVSDAPYGVGAVFEGSAGEVVVTVLGDGFVRAEGERVPLEALVLSLRQRTRTMSKEARSQFVVRLQSEPHDPTEEAQARADADCNRLLDQLYIMNVGQVLWR